MFSSVAKPWILALCEAKINFFLRKPNKKDRL
jgi:hypothetical protein